MDKFAQELAKLDATARCLIESGDPRMVVKGRATLGVLIPVVKWLATEQAIGGNPQPALEAFTDALGRCLIMVADMASPEGQSPMVGVQGMMSRMFAVAHIYAETHAERVDEQSEGKP